MPVVYFIEKFSPDIYSTIYIIFYFIKFVWEVNKHCLYNIVIVQQARRRTNVLTNIDLASVGYSVADTVQLAKCKPGCSFKFNGFLILINLHIHIGNINL